MGSDQLCPEFKDFFAPRVMANRSAERKTLYGDILIKVPSLPASGTKAGMIHSLLWEDQKAPGKMRARTK